MNSTNKDEEKIARLIDKYALINIGINIRMNYEKGLMELRSVTGEIKKFVVPDFIQLIGTECFAYNQYIEEIYLGEGVQIIETGAFMRCIRLKILDMSKSNISVIRGEICGLDSRLEEVRFNKNQISRLDIGCLAFAYCSRLKQVNLPKCVTSLGDSAFFGCNQLTHVEQSLDYVGDRCFSQTGIEKFDVSKLEHIGDSAFSHTHIEKIELNIKEGDSISSRAFSYNESLGEVKISYSGKIDGLVKPLDTAEKLFEGCTIHSLKIGSGINEIPVGTFKNASIDKIEGMERITIIQIDAFKHATVGEGICLDNVDLIGVSAFEDMRYNWGESLELGKNSVGETELKRITICKDAFRNYDKSLKKVAIYNAEELCASIFSKDGGEIKSILIDRVNRLNNIFVGPVDNGSMDDGMIVLAHESRVKNSGNKEFNRYTLKYNNCEVLVRNVAIMHISMGRLAKLD